MNNCFNICLIASMLLISVCTSYGQIILDNGSFEATPADATMPPGWFAASDGTTPDILPGYWGVYNEPSDGETYIGIITRSDGSYESISQRLKSELKEGACYTISFDLAVSDNYTGYNNPIHLRIWIASINNKREQLIYKSELVKNEEWKTHKVDFTPESDKYYFIIEAHISDKPISHEGSVLIDNISPITNCNRA